MKGLTRDTYNELIDRKLIWVFGFLALIAIGSVFLANQGAVRFESQGVTAMEKEQASVVVDQFVAPMIDGYLGFVLLIAVFGTAGLIPKMLEKGRAEYYLAQPISRAGLLLGKMFGIWIVYGGMMIGVGILMVFTVTMLRGAPDAAVLLMLMEKLVAFFVWLSVATIMAVATGSTGFTIIAVFSIWIIQKLLLQREALYQLIDNRFVEILGNGLYYILPKFSQLDEAGVALAKGQPVESWMPVWSTALFGVVITSLAVVLFRRKDY